MADHESDRLERSHGVAALVMKLCARDEISETEERVLSESISEIREVAAGQVLIRAGQELKHCTLLMEGMVCRYRDVASGERQIQELHVAGDFVDLHSLLLKRLDHNIGSLTRCRVALVPHARLVDVTEQYPHLVRMLWFSTLLDAAVQRETILSIGRRSALARIAHLICELSIRLQLVGLSDGKRFALPLTQVDIADATGLTPVHVNRMLRQLREEAMMTFRQGWVEILDWNRLAAVAEFDPAYLHLERRPR